VRFPFAELASPSPWLSHDFSLEVDGRQIGTNAAYYGITFGWSDIGYYNYIISGGSFSLYRFDLIGDEWKAATLQHWYRSPYILLPPSTNRLKVIRTGAEISLYVNEHWLYTYKDTTHVGYSASGVFTVAGLDTPTDVRFDNFALCQLPPGNVAVPAWVSDPAPKRNTTITLYAALIRDGIWISGVPMHTTWHFWSGSYSCDGVSGPDGVASCSLYIGNPMEDYTIRVDVDFTYQDEHYYGYTSFTPNN
jgi:hypothetical protein